MKNGLDKKGNKSHIEDRKAREYRTMLFFAQRQLNRDMVPND